MRSNSQEMADPDPVYLVVDEFQQFVSDSFADILTRARRLGLHLIGAQQYVGQGMSSDFLRNIKANTNIKAVGLYTEPSAAKTAAGMISADPQDLHALGNGKFMFRVGNKPVVAIQITAERLGHAASMSAQDWQKICAQQLRAHYRPAGSFDDPPTSSPASAAAQNPGEDIQQTTHAHAPPMAHNPNKPPRPGQSPRAGHPRYKAPKTF